MATLPGWGLWMWIFGIILYTWLWVYFADFQVVLDAVLSGIKSNWVNIENSALSSRELDGESLHERITNEQWHWEGFVKTEHNQEHKKEQKNKKTSQPTASVGRSVAPMHVLLVDIFFGRRVRTTAAVLPVRRQILDGLYTSVSKDMVVLCSSQYAVFFQPGSWDVLGWHAADIWLIGNKSGHWSWWPFCCSGWCYVIRVSCVWLSCVKTGDRKVQDPQDRHSCSLVMKARLSLDWPSACHFLSFYPLFSNYASVHQTCKP